MGKDKEKPKYAVINSNIIFSSIIKEEGFTRAALLFLKDISRLKFLVPKTVVTEVKLNIGQISRKSGLSHNTILAALENMLEGTEKVNEFDLGSEIREGLKYVNDEDDTPFVAIALKFRPSFIMTYNKKDYKIKSLEKLDVFVVTPKELLSMMDIEDLEFESRQKKKGNLMHYFGKFMMKFRKQYQQ